MAHLHSTYDCDMHFKIDPITRVIKNVSATKTTVIQYDHNSERFTFELPRYIEGHDMSDCNSVEVHYMNGENNGIYLVDDLQVSPDDEEVVICSWLLSQNVTQNVGSLSFLLRFACLSENDVVDYVWNTAIHTSISVSKGIYNSDTVAEQYTDTIKAWENRLKVVENSIGSGGISPIVNLTPITNGTRVTIVDVNGTKSFNVMNGTNGTNGINGTNGVDGKDGTDGVNGIDGVSPTIVVSRFVDGHRVTITDVNGEHSFDVMDGEDGESGITTETDPTIPAWAKEEHKPSYTASEVGAVTEARVLELITKQLGDIENGTY